MRLDDELLAEGQLARELRAMLDPENRQRKTVQQLVRDLMTERATAWQQATKLAAELRTLKAGAASAAQPTDEGDQPLDAYWRIRT